MAKCKGLIWRYTKSEFASGDLEIGSTIRIKLLKRQSCNYGCNCSVGDCEYWMLSYLQEDISQQCMVPRIEGSPKDGDTLKFNWIMSDPEDGFEDLWFEVINAAP